MAETNKVKFGLSKCYYAIKTEVSTSHPNGYETPVPLPGAVNLSLSQEGDTNTFRADNIDYYVSASNNGYSGDLELALVPDSFRTDVLGEVVDSSAGIQYEAADVQPVEFALLFQFEGDAHSTRHVLYNVKATRPDVSSETTGETIEPGTETLSIRATARVMTVAGEQRPIVKAKCSESDSAYTTFFSSVKVPTSGS
jgi:phage major tail protein, phi13 family